MLEVMVPQNIVPFRSAENSERSAKVGVVPSRTESSRGHKVSCCTCRNDFSRGPLLTVS